MSSAISEPLVVKILRDLSAGLKACHDLGIAHLDMRTEKVLIDSSGNQKISDFRKSLSVDQEGMKIKYPVRGTSCCISPELKAEEPCLTTKSDIWGLGCIMYQVCTID